MLNFKIISINNCLFNRTKKLRGTLIMNNKQIFNDYDDDEAKLERE